MILFLAGIFWGGAVGVILTLWACWRYVGDLHVRVEQLEPQLSRVTLMEIVDAMEADDEFDEAPGVVH